MRPYFFKFQHVVGFPYCPYLLHHILARIACLYYTMSDVTQLPIHLLNQYKDALNRAEIFAGMTNLSSFLVIDEFVVLILLYVYVITYLLQIIWMPSATKIISVLPDYCITGNIWFTSMPLICFDRVAHSRLVWFDRVQRIPDPCVNSLFHPPTRS